MNPVSLSAAPRSDWLALVFFSLQLAFAASAQLPPSPTTFCRAVLAKQSVTLHGTMLVDSFNSMDPNHSTNGQYDPTKRLDGGDVASAAAGVNVVTDTGNTSIYGHLFTGPSGTVTISGNASIGSIAWVEGGNTGIQPGWYSNNLQVVIPDATLPGLTFTTFQQRSGTVNGTNYNYVVTNGNYKAASLSFSGNMCINGRVVLYLTNGLSISGQGYIYIAPGASLTLYLGGQTSISGHGTINGTGFATNCVFIGLPSCTSIQETGGSEFVGTIYAPEASVGLGGGGSQLVNFAGAVVANTINISGNYEFHFDQSLCGGCLPPTILTSPSSQNACPGDSVNFTVVATGLSLSYQWYEGGALLAGQTHSSLLITNVTAANAGTYSVAVRTVCGSAVTNSATLTVNNQTLIIRPPTDQTVCAGGNAAFSVDATGTTLSYQWYKAAALLAGATTSSLTTSNTQSGDAGIYSVVVNGRCGLPQTNSAMLTVNNPILVVHPPVDQRVCLGDMAHFSVDATGTLLSYQWFKAATLLAGATTSSLLISNAQPADAGSYSVIVTGVCGQPQTNSATLIVNNPVVVVHSPTDQSVCPGDTAHFTVDATGTALTYQWFKAATLLAGATTSSLVISNAQSGDGALYSVVVGGTCGRSQTNSANLTVNSALVVVHPPTDQSTCAGDTVQFSVNATGTSLSYQWYKAATLIADATTSSLVISNTQTTDAAIYSVVVSGACGQPQTNSATLTVNNLIVVVHPPTDQTVCPGDNAHFAINATGTALGYQWYKAATLLNGETTSSLVVTNAQSADVGIYSVVVTGTCGQPQTNSATLTVSSNVVITMGPSDQAVCQGSLASFSVTASGAGLSFQWYHGNSLLAGHTASVLTVTNVQPSDAGLYTVIVSGHCGMAQTNSATLTINSPALVIHPPTDQSVCPGETAYFSVDATGTALSYQWFKAATLLAGATTSSLNITNAQSTDAGIYSVVVSGTCGQPQTNHATLTVNSPVLVVHPPTDQSVCPGETAHFTVDASGTALAYQWFRATTLLTGATTSSLTITNAQSTNAATYSVVVSGICSQPQTNSATLTVNSPVLVVHPPANQNVCAGDTAHFAIDATGTALSYQWFKVATLLAGATTSSLTISNAQSADAAIYSVVISGACGHPQTNNATLTVNSPVLVVQPPTDQSVCPGDTAHFAVDATGTALTYQWFRATTLLAGATTSGLTITNAQSTNAATYSVVVSGICSQPQTNSATLTVNTPVLVVHPPTNQNVCAGDTAHFSIDATGASLSYQWYKAAAPIAGSTTNSLTISNAQSADAAIYSVVISSACGHPQTNSATLTVNTPVLVIHPPTDQSVCPGDTAHFSVDASGTALTYQWFKGTTLLAGATTSSLTITNAQSTNAAVYSVIVSGICGQPQTNNATLTVNSSVLVVHAPTDQSVCPGDTAEFVVDATGTGLAYQWFKAATLVAGATTSSLNITNAQSTDAGIYSVVVSGTCGHSQTNRATLTVGSPVLVVHPPTDQTVCAGDTGHFAIDATGTGLTYQWYKAAVTLAGATTSSLSVSNAQSADAGIYSVVVTGTCGQPQTNSATLTVNSPVLVVHPPSDQTVCPGDNAEFVVDATGTGVAYQWFKAANLLAGATSSSLTVTNAQSNDVGIYSVVVSGVCGLARSNSATLTVSSNVVIILGPSNQTVCQGSPASFSVTASGAGLTFQWYHINDLLAGQTGSDLVFTNVQPSDGGVYTVIVSGHCGISQTNSASLTVNGTTTASPMGSVTKNLGDSTTFATLASGAGPFTYVWLKNGTVLAGRTNSSITLTNLGYADAGVYTVRVTGQCNTAEQSATLTINHPPTVTIVSPTNGAIFIAPANFTVLADAQDIDGYVTNVDFFLFGTNRLGSSTNVPYFVELTNVAAGTYTYTARAFDNLGATGVSTPVTITVLPRPPLSIVSAIQFNPQTGLFDETVRVSNPTYSTYDAVRIYVGNLTNNAVLWNATGTTNGTAYVESSNPVPPGSHVDFVLEYYVPSRLQPNPTLTPVLVPPAQGGGVTVSGFQQHIDRILVLPNHTVMVEFATITNRLYYIQYTSDMRLWKTAAPALRGNGTKIQWIDAGPPKTDNPPSAVPSRSYRLILLP